MHATADARMFYIVVAAAASVLLFVAMLAAQVAGGRIGGRARKAVGAEAEGGTGAVEGAVFALLGLLIAFTFSGAASRFDSRRQLVVEETNDIGTAYLRVALLPADRQPALRETFRKYLDSRIATYQKASDFEAARDEMQRSNALQTEIWKQAVEATQLPGVSPDVPLLLMPALNAMFDITTTRAMATKMHPPAIIFMMLFGLAIAAALLAGYGMSARSRRPWLHMVVFAAAMALSAYVILDLEYPRLGLIRVDDFDEALVVLRATMN